MATNDSKRATRWTDAKLAAFKLPDGSTAQHAWFTGFAPFDDPEVVVTVYFNRGIGGEKAAPIAGEILRYFYDEMKNR